jgi:ribonuclease-3
VTTRAAHLDELQERLGIRFVDERLLARALVHRSYAFENGGLVPNERLEFLGDAVLALVVTDEIFHLQAGAAEGRLAKIRAAAVKTGSLAQVGRDLGLGEFVHLGKGEAASGGAAKESILADTLEAVIGAYYLDRGFHAAYDLVQGLFGGRLGELVGTGAALDYKTSLQELSASRHGSLPAYVVTDVGPDHEKTFTATVSVDGQPVGRGEGRSKKQAEQRAAREAYHHLADEADLAADLADGIPLDGSPVGTGGRGDGILPPDDVAPAPEDRPPSPTR